MGNEGLTTGRRRPILSSTKVPENKRLRRLSYLVAVPVPRLNRKGKPVETKILESAIQLLLKTMGTMFGGAKMLRSPGAYRMADGEVLMDDDEPVIVSFTSRREFKRRRGELARLARKAGNALDQESMAVLACPAEGLIVFTERNS